MQHAHSPSFDLDLVICRAHEQAAAMNQAELFNWVDDFDLILSKMPQEAQDAYYTAHRQLVTEAIISEWSES